MLCAEERGDGFLLDMRIVLLESAGEMKGHDWEPGIVVGASFIFFTECDTGRVLQLVDTLRAMDVAHAFIPLRQA